MTVQEIDERLAGIEQGIESLALHQEELFRLLADRVNQRDAEIDKRFRRLNGAYQRFENRTSQITSQPTGASPAAARTKNN